MDGKTHEVDARPSDALNLALRLNAPILVASEVMDAQGVRPPDLPAKLAKDQESIEGKLEWVSVLPPDLEMHRRPPQEK